MKIVRRTDVFEGKEINSYKLKDLNNSMCRVLIRLVPTFGEEFPHLSLSYISKSVSLNMAYVEEILDFLSDRDIVSFDGENFYLSRDNLWKLQDYINSQPMLILARKITGLDG